MLKDYIFNKFDECVRENIDDNGSLIGLPYPYTVPSVADRFQEMYYWDTYFTNKGLIIGGKCEQAKNNVDNIIYLVNKFGYMPNGNRTYYLKSSQPPFLSLMVFDIYKEINDKKWLKNAVEALTKEYDFWMTRRNTEIGLNRYGCNPEMPGYEGMAAALEGRIGVDPGLESDSQRAEHFIACCESGWDMTPRFEFEAFNYAPVCLNSLMYLFEINMSYFCCELQEDDTWKERAEKRTEIMRSLLKDSNGIFYDYNFNSKKHSPIFSVASAYPLFCGMATQEEALILKNKLIEELETDYGILTCKENDFPGKYQWDSPNGWAPLQFITVFGLLKYGFNKDAYRIALKYVNIVENNFKLTNNLWEKYNVMEGNVNIAYEINKMPPMIGWTAGVYLSCKKLVTEQIFE